MSSLGDLYTHLKTLCEQWFYNKSQVDTALNGKISKSNTVGLVKNDGSIDTTNYSTFSGDYDDLTDKPNIPSKTSDLVNDGDDGTNPFVSDDDSRLSDARTPTSHTHGYINNDGTIDVNSASFSTLNYPLVRDNSDGKLKTGLLSTYSVKDSRAYSNIGSSANADQTTINGKINTAIGNINTSLSGKASSSHTHSSTDVTEASALSNIGTSANATQHDINSAIDSAISNLTGADITKVVTTLPTASASTMNALYLLSSNGQYDIYITIEDNEAYSWEKLDDDVLSDLSIDWSDIENKPSTFTPSSHTHGNINANGTISTTIATSSIAGFSTLNFPLVRDSTDSAKIKIGLVPTDMVRSSTAYSNIGSSANATQSTINSAIDTAIGGLWDGVNGKRNIQRAHTSNADDVVEEGHYYTLGGIVNTGQNQGMSFLDVMVDDYDRIVQVCYEYDYGEVFDNDVHQYIRYSTNNGSTWSSWKRFVEEAEFTTALNGKASSSHNHGNILNGGTITQTGTNGGNLVVTNSNNAVVVESVIDVMDGLIQNLISYGGS